AAAVAARTGPDAGWIELVTKPVIAIDQALVARANARDGAPAAAGEAVPVGLAFDPAEATGHPPMVRVVPPDGGEPEMGVWLMEVMDRLVGSKDEVHMARTGSSAMQRAHRRAPRELPDGRSRFLDRLAPGEALYLTRGFP